MEKGGRRSVLTIEVDPHRAVPEIIRELAKTHGVTFDVGLLADIYNDGRVDSLPETRRQLISIGSVHYDEPLSSEEAVRRITTESKTYTPATARQLLTCALRRPAVKGIAPGTQITLKGRRYVFSLSLKDGVPALEVLPDRREVAEETWEPGTEFAMVSAGVA